MLNFSEFLKRFPKADLHYHLLGGVRRETMLSLAEKYNEVLTVEEASAYYRGFAQEGQGKGGIAALHYLYGLLREPEDYYRVLCEIAEDAVATGVRYIETFWNPCDTPMPYEVVTDALIDAAKACEEKMGVIIRLVPAINREKSPEQAVSMVEQVIRHSRPEVLGIGIDYKEQDASVEKFWKAYRLAEQNDLKLTAHCSEFGLHWRNVEAGLDLINLDRIDHGYSVVENPALMQRCVNEAVPFTVIPSNTYFLRQWPDHAEWCKKHPIRTMAQAGMMLIPCTDDWHIHNTDGAEVYRVMVEDFGFDLDGIRQLMLNGIEGSWLSAPVKRCWMKEWTAEFDALRAQLNQEPVIEPEHLVQYG